MGLRSVFDERTVAAMVIASSVVVSFAWHEAAHALAPYVLESLFAIVVFSLIPFGLAADRTLLRVDPLSWHVVLWQQFLVPSCIFVVGIVAGMSTLTLSLLLVAATSGSLFASPTILKILDLNHRRGVQCMALSTLVMPVSLFLFLGLLHGPELELDMALYVERIIIFLVVPIFIVWFATTAASNVSPLSKVKIACFSRWASVIALFVFAVGMLDEVTERLVTDPETVYALLGLAVVFGVVVFVATVAFMAKLGYREGVTAGVLGSFRNVGLSFALVNETMHADLAVFVGIILIPVFLAPLAIRIMQAILVRSPVAPNPA